MKRYVRSAASVEASTKDTWSSIKKLLESEFENGTDDPIFGYEAKIGKKILPLMDAVQQDLGVDFDGQFNDGEGVVEFVTIGDDPELVVEGHDFQTFYRKLIGMIMEANSAQAFKQAYRQYLETLINDENNKPDDEVELESDSADNRSKEWRARNAEHPGWVHRDFESWDEAHVLMRQLYKAGFHFDHLGDRDTGRHTVWYPPEANVSSTTIVNAATTQRMTDFQLEHLLDLADDMLYQVYDNNRYDDYSKKDIIDMVIEHVIMVITEMDDDGVYEDLVPFASTKNRQFMRNLKEHVGEMYDTYEWGA